MLQTKQIPLSQCEFKFTGDTGQFEGYASVFNGVDSHGDTILPGAFKHVQTMPKMFFNHDWDSIPIGKYEGMSEDSKGLHMKGSFTLDIPKAKDVYAAMKAGTLDGMSIGGWMRKGDYEPTDGHGRIIKKWSELVEVSVVTFPSDKSARISSLKSEEFGFETVRDFERFLRDVGFTRNEALALVSKTRKLFQGEPEDAMKPVLAKLEQLRSKLS
jgi:uncharacterized protein